MFLLFRFVCLFLTLAERHGRSRERARLFNEKSCASEGIECENLRTAPTNTEVFLRGL